MKKEVEVVAALIWRGEKFLACRRPEGKARALLWEFAGGKVEPGESKREALVRECREELAITVDVNEIYAEVSHVYPDISVHLTLFSCTIAQGEPRKIEHSELRWITPEEIPSLRFCPADAEILERLQREKRNTGIKNGEKS